MKSLSTIATAALIFVTSFGATAMTTQDFAVSPAAVEVSIQDEFTEIETKDLPEKVKETLSEDYRDFEIKKAYVNSVKIYKIEIENDNSKETVYIDESGKELEI